MSSFPTPGFGAGVGFFASSVAPPSDLASLAAFDFARCVGVCSVFDPQGSSSHQNRAVVVAVPLAMVSVTVVGLFIFARLALAVASKV